MLRALLVIVLVLMLLGSLPVWSFSSGWGYYPVGGLSFLIIVLVVIFFSGRSRV